MGPGSTHRLRQAYRDVSDIDLFVGGLAERPVIGGLVGPTFACILAQQFSNLRKGDRFWYENGGFESSFTPAQLASIRQVTLSQVLCRQFDGGTVQPHAFLPPDTVGNDRQVCGRQSLIPIDLIPWTEHDPLNKKHDNAPTRQTVAALKPQPMTDDFSTTNKKKTKKRKKKPAPNPPNFSQKEAVLDGISAKLDLTNVTATAKPTKKEALQATAATPTVSDKIDKGTMKVTDNKKRKDSAATTATVSDKLDFTKQTPTKTVPKTTTLKPDESEPRHEQDNRTAKLIPTIQLTRKDPNIVNIAIRWNNNWNPLLWSGMKPAAKPVISVHDKVSLNDYDVPFITGLKPMPSLNDPLQPTPAASSPFSPFSYDPTTLRPQTDLQDATTMTFWTVDHVPIYTSPPTTQIFDIRNTIKPKPGQTTTTPSTRPQTFSHIYHISKNPPYYHYPNHVRAKPGQYSNSKTRIRNDETSDLSLQSKSMTDLTLDLNSTSGGNFTLTPAPLPTTVPNLTDHDNDTDSINDDDYNDDDDDDDENYDSPTKPPTLEDTDSDYTDWTDDSTLTQFDRDGYLRPEHMNLDLLTIDRKRQEDFKTVTLLRKASKYSQARRPIAVDIEAEEVLNVVKNNRPAEEIAFVPLVVLTSPER